MNGSGGPGIVCLPRPRDSLHRLSASSIASPSPVSPSGRRGSSAQHMSPPTWQLADGAGPQCAAVVQHEGGDLQAAGDSPPLLALLRASIPLDSPAASEEGTPKHASGQQATVDLLYALNGRQPVLGENDDASHHGGGGKKWGGRLGRFGRSSSKAAAAELETSAASNSTNHLFAAVPAGPPAQAPSPVPALAEADAISAKAHKSKQGGSGSGWFNSVFSSNKSNGKSKAQDAVGVSTRGKEGAVGSAAPIMGGLPFLPLPGADPSGPAEPAAVPQRQLADVHHHSSGSTGSGSSRTLSSSRGGSGRHPAGGPEGVAPYPLASPEASEGGTSQGASPAASGLLAASLEPAVHPQGEAAAANGKKFGHRRQRSLTSIISHGLGLKGLRTRRHSGGNAEEVMGAPAAPVEASQGSAEMLRNKTPSPHQGDLLIPPVTKPAPSGGSPALSCFGLGVRQATVGDDEASPVAQSILVGPTTPALDPSLEIEEGPILPLSTLGIRNIGNSCFLGAALQCLRHTPNLPLLIVPDLVQQVEAAQLSKAQQPQRVMEAQAPAAAQGGAPAEAALAGPGALQEQQEGAAGKVAEACGAEAGAAANAAGVQGPLQAGSQGCDAASPMAAALQQQEQGPAAAVGAGPEGLASLQAAVGAAGESDAGAAGAEAQERAPAAGETVAKERPAPSAEAEAVAVAAEALRQQPAAAGVGGAEQPQGTEPKSGPAAGSAAAAAGATAEGESSSGGAPPAEAAAAMVAARPKRPERGVLLECFGEVVRNLYMQSGVAGVDPYSLLRLLKQFPTAADYFDGGQHDCQEVLRVLMDLLHDELNRVPQPPPALPEEKAEPAEEEGAKADRFWRRYLARDSSPITDLFSGQLQSSVTCHGCGKRFTMYEPFWDLSLPLAKEGKNSSLSWLGIKGTPATIQDCLRVFTADERLEGEESFHCEVCKDKTAATKHLRIHRFPDVLVLHIKRFKYKGSNTDKLSANVSFPLKELQLHQFASPECPTSPEDCTYDLFGVSNHYGTLSGGHYTAMCRVLLGAGSEAWYSYNDEVVSCIPAQQVVSQHAYILFYTRRKYRTRAPSSTRHRHSNSGGSSSGD